MTNLLDEILETYYPKCWCGSVCWAPLYRTDDGFYIVLECKANPEHGEPI